MQTRMRTAGIWIETGHVLLESLADREVWGIPGGRLEPDESVEQGCIREYRDELGIEIHCQRLALINEHFWHDGDVFVREYAFCFLIRPTYETLSLPPIQSCEKHLKFQWFPLEKLDDLIMVPSFLKTVLPQLGDETVFLTVTE